MDLESEQTVSIEPSWLAIWIKAGILIVSLLAVVVYGAHHYPISTTCMIKVFAMAAFPLAFLVEEVTRDKKETFMTRVIHVIGSYFLIMIICLYTRLWRY